ncbi:hypothetical protein [Salinilacihabitans rarus]|uniref:hypothetical protein n=1 Tax=Salinilacihabitans rarus TaxID=2961596 RepID=UPI0020C8DD70|nr:hypothetical protein [Salinilacihabitans rarus]
MPSDRSPPLARVGVALAFGAVALAGTAAAQSRNPAPELGFGTRFAASFVVNLLFGGLLVALGPRYARETVGDLRADPGGAFVWGLLLGIGVPILLFVLAITIIGLIVAIPAGIVLAVVGFVGAAVTVVWIGDLLLSGREAGVGGAAVVVGALALAVPYAIPVLGDLVATVVGFFGLGAVGRGLYESWQG